MKKLWVSILIFIYAATSSASEIWVTTSSLSSEKRLDEVTEASNQKLPEGDFVSIFQGELRTPVSKAALTHFIEEETFAQKNVVTGNFHGALEQYLKLRSELLKVPNVSGVEKISLAVVINIAQIKSLLRQSDADQWWSLAHAWSPAAQLSEDEFSPQIVKKFSAIYPPKSLQVMIETYSEAMVFVDGRRVAQNGDQFAAKLEPGEHQVCALAPGSSWTCKNFTLDSQRAQDPLRVEVAPIVEGSCDDPHYTGPALPPSVRLLVHFEDENCERIYSQQRWYSILGHHIESLAPQTSTLFERPVIRPEEPSVWNKLSHSTWFWAGVSAVVIGAIVISAQNQNHEPVVVPSQSFR